LESDQTFLFKTKIWYCAWDDYYWFNDKTSKSSGGVAINLRLGSIYSDQQCISWSLLRLITIYC